MKTPRPIVIDFETDRIERRPQYPPVPVGVSIKYPGQKSVYHAWGHPTKNNTTKSEAKRQLEKAWRSGEPLLFHNDKFDYDVATTHMGAKELPWDRLHDTMFLLFLRDPHARSLSLKPAAERILDMKPEERDVVKEWVLANVPEAKRKPSEWGAYICKAPGDMVGRYANGDCVRTEKLFVHTYPEIVDAGMLKPYDRERQLMPILLQTEREGMRVNLKLMEDDYSMYLQALGTAERWLRKALKSPDLDFEKDQQVADALENNGIITDWVYTTPTKRHPDGVRSIAKKNMALHKFENKRVAEVYGYRARLATCMSTFYEPWLEMARESNGFIYTTWNQVRQSHDEKSLIGARTGRLSSSPNFQNIPTDFLDKGDGYSNPDFLKSLPLLPFMRKYWLPDPGHIWMKRDFSGQELRILAHFEDGGLLNHYNTDPKFDMHTFVQKGLAEQGQDFPRGKVKILNFQQIYGGGYNAFSAMVPGIDQKTYKSMVAAKMKLMPDYKTLDDGIKNLGKAGLPITTWGGRQYYCEPPMYVKKFNRVMTFEYKLLNYLIQGSAADCTKEVVIRYINHPQRQARFLLTVHDELNSSTPSKRLKEEMKIMKECMASVSHDDVNKFDCEMKSDGEFGPNWSDLEDYKD